MRRYLLLCIAMLSAGCLDSLDKTTIKCTTKEHCPSDLVCVFSSGAASGICKQGAAAVDSGGRDMPVADATLDQAGIDVGAGGTGMDVGAGGSFGVDAPSATGGAGGLSGIDAIASGGAGGTTGDSFDAPLVDSSPDVPIVDAPGSCGTDKDCPAQAPICLANRCAKCASDNDCVGRSGPACAASGLCVACTASSYCKGAAATCDTATNQCVGCTKRSDCAGACQTCSAGVCVAVKNQDDPTACAGTCDTTGACKGKQGQTCKASSDCCDKACNAACWSCNLPGKEGTCSADPNGSSCGTDAVCSAGTCGVCVQDQPCNTSTACQVWKIDCGSGTSQCSKRSNLAANTSCGSASCTGSIRTAAGKCDTGGTCVSGAQTSCVTGCNGTDCAALLAEGSTCSSNAQCQSGACGLGAGTTNVHNTCNSLAGTVNQTCYFDSTCRSSNLVCNGNTSDPKCVACGTSGGQCCPGSTCAAAGLYCNSGYCAACGSSGQPCCPGSPATCLTGYACVSGSYCGGVAGTSCYGSVSPCAPPLVCPLGAGSVCTAP
jgi:hypothetical protein